MSQNFIPTPHINATGKDEIAKTVLMPGDPLRAKYIADNFLENPVQFNKVRGMLGFTGTYKGHRVSVMGSGMGMPSIGIYSYELYKFYGVENIIRVGSCGAYTPDLGLYEIVLTDSVYSPSSYRKMQNGNEEDIIEPSKRINDTIKEVSKDCDIPINPCRIVSSDVFYAEQNEAFEAYTKHLQDLDCKAVEMESFALFTNAETLGKNAACILTVSDNIATQELTSAEERQTAFTKMMELGLEAAIRL